MRRTVGVFAGLIFAAGCSHAAMPPGGSPPQAFSPALVRPAPMARTRRLPSSAMRTTRHTQDSISGPNWHQIPGSAAQVAAAPDGSLWALSLDPSGPDKYMWHYANGNWTNVSGLADRIAVAPNGTLYALNSGGGTYAYNNGSWTALGGGAKAITVASDGSVYVISNASSGDQAIWHNVNGVWSQANGSGGVLAASWDAGGPYAGTSGTLEPAGVYILNSAGQIWYENSDGSFAWFTGTASAIAATQTGGVFVLSYPAVSGGEAIYYYNLDSSGWTQQPGAAVSITANGSTLYAVSTLGGIYYTAYGSPLTFSANSLAFLDTSTVQKVTVSESGYGGTFTTDSTHSSCLNGLAGPGKTTVSTTDNLTFSIQATQAGACTIVFDDSSSPPNSGTVNVSITTTIIRGQ